MMRNENCGKFVLQGETVAKNHGVTYLPVDIMELARENNIEIRPKPDGLTTGVSGMLIRKNRDHVIIYSTYINNVGFQNFSIAHELGHYFLPGHTDAVFAEGNKHESLTGFTSDNRIEREADCFAVGLLMPKHLFKEAMSKVDDGLSAIEHLAGRCQTSLIATSIRFAQLSDTPIAIVVSTKDRIDYCFMSDELKSLDGIDWIRKGEPLSKNTATFRFNQDAGLVRHASRTDGTSNVQDWFGGRRSIEMAEEIVGLGNYGKTLTVLTLPDLPDPDDIEEEDRLVESWKPRF